MSLENARVDDMQMIDDDRRERLQFMQFYVSGTTPLLACFAKPFGVARYLESEPRQILIS